MANTFKFGNKNWAVKKDSVLAYNDENNNFKPLPFDFTRDSIATYVDSDGLIKTAQKGIARIDYLDNADGHLLLEPARANLVANSNAPSSGGGRTTKSGTTIKFVDGVTDVQSDKSILASGTPYTYYNNITLETNTPYTFSVFVRKTESNPLSVNHVKIASTNRFPSNDTIFSLDSGTVVSTEHDNATITSFNDGWYRITVTEVSTSAGQGFNFIVYPAVDSSGTNADITAVGQEILYINGFQIEEESYATSYIPTEGSSVTRVADTCNDAGNSTVFDYSEGTFFMKVNLADNSTSFRVSLSDGTGNNKLFIGTISSAYYYEVRAIDTSVSASILSAITQDTSEVLLAGTWKQNEFKFFVNGTKVNEDLSGNTPVNLSKIRFNNLASINPFYGKVKDLRVYNTALTDAELIALTSN